MGIKCMIVDDHHVVSMGLKTVLQHTYPDWSFDSVSTVNAALDRIGDNAEAQIDLVLLDLNLPDQSGIVLLQHLQKTEMRYPLSSIVITGNTDPKVRESCKVYGALGFVGKDEETAEILAAIDDVLHGNPHFEFRRAQTSPDNPFLSLTDTKRDVLDLTMHGLANAEIAEILELSIGTVKNYIIEFRQLHNLPNRGRLRAFAESHMHFPDSVEAIRRKNRTVPVRNDR